MREQNRIACWSSISQFLIGVTGHLAPICKPQTVRYYNCHFGESRGASELVAFDAVDRRRFGHTAGGGMSFFGFKHESNLGV